jgi:hypothetical protein
MVKSTRKLQDGESLAGGNLNGPKTLSTESPANGNTKVEPEGRVVIVDDAVLVRDLDTAVVKFERQNPILVPLHRSPYSLPGLALDPRRDTCYVVRLLPEPAIEVFGASGSIPRRTFVGTLDDGSAVPGRVSGWTSCTVAFDGSLILLRGADQAIYTAYKGAKVETSAAKSADPKFERYLQFVTVNPVDGKGTVVAMIAFAPDFTADSTFPFALSSYDGGHCVLFNYGSQLVFFRLEPEDGTASQTSGDWKTKSWDGRGYLPQRS